MSTNPEFKEFNKLQILITGSKVNTPEDLEDLLKLLDERDVEIRRLAKVFDLEHLLEGKVTWNLEVIKQIKNMESKKVITLEFNDEGDAKQVFDRLAKRGGFEIENNPFITYLQISKIDQASRIISFKPSEQKYKHIRL